MGVVDRQFNEIEVGARRDEGAGNPFGVGQFAEADLGRSLEAADRTHENGLGDVELSDGFTFSLYPRPSPPALKSRRLNGGGDGLGPGNRDKPRGAEAHRGDACGDGGVCRRGRC